MAAHTVSMGRITKDGKRPKKKLKDMSVDEFFSADLDNSSDTSSSKSFESNPRVKKKGKASQNTKNPLKVKVKTKNKKSPRVHVEETPKQKKTNKKDLAGVSLADSLKENDPEFYNFLKGEDQELLNNLDGLSASESEDSDDDAKYGDESEIVDEDQFLPSQKSKDIEKDLLNMSSGEDDSDDDEPVSDVHKLPDKLEVASDDSDADSDEETHPQRQGSILVTSKLINSWTKSLKESPSHAVLKQVVSAFRAAVQEAGGSESEEKEQHKYKVEGGTVFNSVIRLCLTQIAPALQSILQLPVLSEAKQLPNDNMRRWKKIKVDVKSYITDMLQLLSQLSEAAMVNAILKHVHKLIIFFATFPKLARLLLKRMIKIWTSGEETTRVLAFLCINKIVRLKQDVLLEKCLKQMYSAYVSNCKFTSPSTLPLINFMQRSLVEMFSIDQTLAYQYAFVYIRQMAIHLRNAITLKKKNTCQAVYNWQFIHCLSLWVQLLSTAYPSETLKPLIYPLTQTIIGTIRLLPTARFYPLRFHCIKLLNVLSSKTETFIPTLPFLLEIFEQTDFNKRHKNVSLKPFNFSVILKLSKAQLLEKAFKDGLVDQLYEHMLESYNIHAHSVGFPELIIPSVLQLKTFLKKCKIANYCKQIKQILEKIEEQSKFVTEKRKKSLLSLSDFSSVSKWEQHLKESGTPLRKFYTSWRKLRDRELLHEVANKEAISGAAVDIPLVNRKLPNKATAKEREDFSKLFENESESEDETRFLLKEERPDQPGRKRKRQGNESDSDDYSDFDDDELEQLAQSASSSEEEEEEEEMENGDIDCAEDDDEDEKNGSNKSKAGQRPTLKPGERNNINAIHEAEDSENDELGEDIVEDFVMSDSD